MNIQQIRDRYDPENDAHPVTWLEMQLAEEIKNLREDIEYLQGKLLVTQDQILELSDLILKFLKN